MKRVLLTGATGAMGRMVLNALIKDNNDYIIRVFVRDSKSDRKIIKKYTKKYELEVSYGDLTRYLEVEEAVKDVDMVLHVAAFVSPAADYHPELAMLINYGGTKNLVDAITNLGNKDKTKFVFIGTIAQTGDRMPPIHWGRVGDPIKPSIFDYYAVSKVAAERYVIESDLKYWASLRQTGILGKDMFKKSNDPILFHNGFNNVLEYVSDRDSGIMLSNLWNKDISSALKDNFWNHIYNIGGGANTRVDTVTLYENVYKALGIKNLKYVISPKMFATRNFHGTYYLDSDKLNDFLGFRNDSIEYFYDIVKKELGFIGFFTRIICKLPGGQWLVGKMIQSKFKTTARKKFGTLRFFRKKQKPQIDAYFGSEEEVKEIPKSFDDFERYKNWDDVVWIDHGYDESKPESELNLEDMKKASQFRGGNLLSSDMLTGDWKTKLEFECAFGHKFTASPRLILEGGHWCSECEKIHWDYDNRATKDRFFAQVWNPFSKKSRNKARYEKVVNQDIVKQ